MKNFLIKGVKTAQYKHAVPLCARKFSQCVECERFLSPLCYQPEFIKDKDILSLLVIEGPSSGTLLK